MTAPAKIYFVLIVVATLNAGCRSTEVWIVEQQPDSVLLGYQRGSSEEAQKELDQKISLVAVEACNNRPWKAFPPKSRSEKQLVTVLRDQTSLNYGYSTDASGNTVRTRGYSTTQVPVTYQTTVRWNEVVLRCEVCSPTIGAVLDENREIVEFLENSKAHSEGLKIGDKLYNVAGKQATAQLTVEPGQKAKVIFQRNGHMQETHVTTVRHCSY